MEWATIIAAGLAACASIGGATLAGVGARRSNGASRSAAEAADLARPVGNGFTDEVRETLGRIEKRTEKIGQRIDDHLAAHAKADVLHGAIHDHWPPVVDITNPTDVGADRS